MARTKQTALKSAQYRVTVRRAMIEYRSYQREEGKALREFVTHFETLWREINGYYEMEYGGIRKLVELMPESWKEWMEETASRFTWYEPRDDEMDGDMDGFLKVVYCALVDSRHELPPSANEKEDEEEYEDKHVVEAGPVAGNEDRARVGMVSGFEGDYGGNPMGDDDDDLNWIDDF